MVRLSEKGREMEKRKEELRRLNIVPTIIIVFLFYPMDLVSAWLI